MVRLFTFFCFFTCSPFLHGQESIHWTETFSTNERNWIASSSSTVDASVEDGAYIIERKIENKRANLFWNGVVIDPDKEFSIEATVKQINGVDNYGHGIIWGIKDKDNFYSYVISSNGYFNLSKYDQGEYITILEWTKTEFINSFATNVLKISRKGDSLLYMINDKLVHRTANMPFFGQNLGVIVYDKMKVAFDKLTIYQDWPPLNAIEMEGLNIVNLGAGINTKYNEIFPVISPDGSLLFWTRKHHPDNVGGEDAGDDIMYAVRQEDGSWGPAQHMGPPLNTSGNNSVVSVSADNNTLFLANSYKEDGSMSEGFSISHRTNDGWSFPEKVDVEDYYNRSKYVESYLSSDGKILLMCIERDDTYGEKDIYVSFRTDKNQWIPPKNLGPVINTFSNETGPFLAADNKTLYYATDGKTGYGSHDVFMSKRLDDTWQQWSTPKNLGATINTSRWDAYYRTDAKGEYAYLVSSKNSLGKTDLFSMKLPQKASHGPVIMVHGKVLEKGTNLPISAEIEYEILPDGKNAGYARSNPTTGEYKIILPEANHFGYHAIAEGYLAVNENIDIEQIEEHSVLNVDLYLVPLNNGKSIVLNNIFFAQGKYGLLPASFPELDRLVKILSENPTLKIEIGGHTENRGSNKLNVKLSKNRANAVKTYLVDHGVHKKRITTQGYGSKFPIADNNNEQTRKKNRRVEFKILKI